MNVPSASSSSGSIASPTSLTFARYGTSGPVDIEWYVAEFTSGVSVQRGTTVLNGVDNDQNFPISTVDLSKSVPIISYTENGQTYNCDDFHRATLTSTTNLQISSCAPDSTVEWQVVQFTSSSVQTGLVRAEDLQSADHDRRSRHTGARSDCDCQYAVSVD